MNIFIVKIMKKKKRVFNKDTCMVSKAILRGSKNNSRNIDEFSVLYNTKLSHILNAPKKKQGYFRFL